MITPRQAQEWLAADEASPDHNNRTIKPGHVTKLVDDIRNGRWRYNPLNAKLAFGKTGNIMNGQHTLTACVEAGRPIVADVAFDCEPEYMENIDEVAPRTAGDRLTIHKWANANLLAAIARLLIIYKVHKSTDFKAAGPSSVAIQEYVENCGDQIEKAIVHGGRGLCNPRVLGFCNYLFKEQNPILAERFMHQVITGEMIRRGNPVFALRRRLLENAKEDAKLHLTYLIAYFFKAWIAFRNGTSLYGIHWTPGEQFPRI